MIDLTAIEERKQELTDNYLEALSVLYQVEIKKCIRWFKEKFPKRTIEWKSGMGTCFWVLDDEILHWNTLDQYYTSEWDIAYRDSTPDRIAQKLQPLWDVYQSINNASNVIGPPIDTGDIRMEDV